MKKVIFASSSGGHFIEIMTLKSLFKEYDYTLVMEKGKNNINIDKAKYLFYASKTNIIKYMILTFFNIIKTIYLILTINPEVIVSTGAAAGGMVAAIGKIFGKKVIYIESLARIYDLSKTGKFVYKFADKFYVQSSYLAKKYAKAENIGVIL